MYQRWIPRSLQTFRSTTRTITSQELHRPLPPYLYKDAHVYELERQNVFAKNWLYAGRLDQLQKLGDYISITLAGYPVFVYRSPLSRELVAFHNVCSHRAGPIVPINTDHGGAVLYGNQSQLKCHYHAWLFDSRDGSLKGTPNFQYKFQKEEKKCLNLKRIRFETFADQFVFVKISDNEDESRSLNTLLKEDGGR